MRVPSDCLEVTAALSRFWMAALDYVTATPPTGWSTWEAWLRDQGVPEGEWGEGAAIADPAGVGPPITFLKVPEGKGTEVRADAAPLRR